MTWISTVSGKRIDFLNPDMDEICIEDIAHGLAINNRWSGQTRLPVSVADHSVQVSLRVGNDGGPALEALMHDSPEAYAIDLPRPLKMLLPEYTAIEERLRVAIFDKFGLSHSAYKDPMIKGHDDRQLATERRDQQPLAPEWPWLAEQGVEPYDRLFIPVGWEQAKRTFLNRFNFLMGNRANEAAGY